MGVAVCERISKFRHIMFTCFDITPKCHWQRTDGQTNWWTSELLHQYHSFTEVQRQQWSVTMTCRIISINTACCINERIHTEDNKKAQLSLTNPRDAKVCQKLLQFDVLTTLLLTILAYLHSFSCCCVRNLRNPAKFTKNSWSSRSSKVNDLGVNGKPMWLHISQ